MALPPRLLFAIAGVAFAAIVFWPGRQADAVTRARALVGDGKVVMLSAEWCGYCNRLRADLNRRNVPFAEFDVEKTSAGRGAWKELGGRGVPVTLVGDQVIRGYDPQRILALAASGRAAP